MKTFLYFLLLSFPLIAASQVKTIFYQESMEDFANPERGFYMPTGTKSSRFFLLDTAQLIQWRTAPVKSGSAKYSVNISLIYRGYELDSFKDKPLSEEFLQNLQKDFDAIRYAGLKVILRFAYTNDAKGGDCKDEYKICPPYGDAPRAVVMNHISQIKPILRKNADVIAVLQEGFIGIWGENYFTDYFGDASTNGAGKILDSSWRHRNELLKALLDALPADRMVQVRTPQIKQKFVYGPSASVNSKPLTNSLKNNYESRIGFHNDCFLASADDYGTYYDYGSSTQPRQPANDVLRKYIGADTKFTVAGGETCDDAFSPQNDCAPTGYAENEMRRMHFSYLNYAYNNDVNNDWDSLGCMHNIKMHLGYRFVLKKAMLPSKIKRSAPLNFTLHFINRGYAALYNARPLSLILRSTITGKQYSILMRANMRSWFPGNVVVQESLKLPGDLPAGSYQLYLLANDANVYISPRPEYSIRFANSGVWDATTGTNSLQHTLLVQ